MPAAYAMKSDGYANGNSTRFLPFSVRATNGDGLAPAEKLRRYAGSGVRAAAAGITTGTELSLVMPDASRLCATLLSKLFALSHHGVRHAEGTRPGIAALSAVLFCLISFC